MHNILNVIRIYYGENFDEKSISYARFLTHIQYFAHRVVFGDQQGGTDSFLYEQIQASYPKAFECVNRIKHYVKATHHFEMREDEQVYLTIHIERIMSEQQTKKIGDQNGK
ncbi:PRD domain-containing protein [Atopostipes suicloacalis DSM 15692]|uniref:PRD domain-containing protein n=1 Tax=Atopostipes suicloacalis DSM 15692 TaxID=1121025 RepID=A0A1M4ZFL2_9LACT|nr:PRD domain-containing protein [Atopostipes suicloacalis]SHF16386.1 PRD domain-containing protein [Atopostipes suicloacalis DSM 15692]